MNAVVRPKQKNGKAVWMFRLEEREYALPFPTLGSEEFPEHSDFELVLQNIYIDIHHKKVNFDFNGKRISAPQHF